MPKKVIHSRPQWNGLMSKATWDIKRPFAEKMKYKPHPAQLEFHSDMHRFKVPCCGRRFGKSTLCAFEANFCGLMGGWVMCVAPTYNLANKVWLEALMMIQKSEFADQIEDVVTQEGRQCISFKSGGKIVAKSSENPKSLLGDGWDLVIFDEAASEDSAEAWKKGIRPALMDRKGAAIFPSTPLGDNWYHDIFMLGQDPSMKNWWSKSYDSGQNPIMTPDEIEDYIKSCDIPEDLVRQEIYAEFLGSGGVVFKNVKEVCTGEWQEFPIEGHIYAAGLDVGKIHDYTVLAIWDCTLNCLCHLTRMNIVPYPELERYVSRALRVWQCPVLVDITRESGTADHLREDCWWVTVTGFSFGNESKTKIINQLCIGFEERKISILDSETILGEMCGKEFGAFRFERSSSGILKMSAPKGKYDDIVCATALAYEQAIRYTGNAGFAATPPNMVPRPKLENQYSFANDGPPRNVAIGSVGVSDSRSFFGR